MAQVDDEELRKSQRSGCLPAFLCGGLGMLTAFMIGWIDAPSVNPRDPLSNEGYTPFVLVMLMPLGSILGAMAGYVTGGPWRVAGLKGMIGVFIGLLLGLTVGKIIHSTQNSGDGGTLIVHLLISGGTSFFGLLLATWSTERRSRERSRFKESDG